VSTRLAQVAARAARISAHVRAICSARARSAAPGAQYTARMAVGHVVCEVSSRSVVSCHVMCMCPLTDFVTHVHSSATSTYLSRTLYACVTSRRMCVAPFVECISRLGVGKHVRTVAISRNDRINKNRHPVCVRVCTRAQALIFLLELWHDGIRFESLPSNS
jgi:hypothetical protein